MKKEKIIQIAYRDYDEMNPTLLTNKGRLIIACFDNPIHPKWIDITPRLELIK